MIRFSGHSAVLFLDPSALLLRSIWKCAFAHYSFCVQYLVPISERLKHNMAQITGTSAAMLSKWLKSGVSSTAALRTQEIA